MKPWTKTWLGAKTFILEKQVSKHKADKAQPLMPSDFLIESSPKKWTALETVISITLSFVCALPEGLAVFLAALNIFLSITASLGNDQSDPDCPSQSNFGSSTLASGARSKTRPAWQSLSRPGFPGFWPSLPGKCGLVKHGKPGHGQVFLATLATKVRLSRPC